MPCSLYKRLSTSESNQTDKYQYSENPRPAHVVPLYKKTENWCAGRDSAQYRWAHVIQRKRSSEHYIAFILTVSQGINKRENTRLFQAGQCHDTHSNFLSYCTAKGIEYHVR